MNPDTNDPFGPLGAILASGGFVIILIWLLITAGIILLEVWIVYTLIWRAVRRGLKEYNFPDSPPSKYSKPRDWGAYGR